MAGTLQIKDFSHFDFFMKQPLRGFLFFAKNYSVSVGAA